MYDTDLKRLQMTNMITEDFVLGQSPWELYYSTVYRVDTKKLRQILLGTMVHRKFSLQRKSWIAHRWIEGLFDVVTEDFFCIADVIVPTLKLATFKGTSPYFLRDEVDEQSTYSGGRRDVTFLDLNVHRWGLHEKFKAVREKLNGSRFVRPSKDRGILRGFVDIRVQNACPIDLLEYTEYGMRVLHPYAIPDFEQGGIVFKSHQWKVPSQQEIMGYLEGVMILVQDGEMWTEYRCKREPTSEMSADQIRLSQKFMYDGIWEVKWVSKEQKFVPLRPRPGKSVSAVSCRDLPSLSHLLVPDQDYYIENRTLGGYRGIHFRGGVGQHLVVDSGYRIGIQGGYGTGPVIHVTQGLPVLAPWSKKIEVIEGLFNYQTKIDVKISPYPVHADFLPEVMTGAKIFPVREGKVAVMRDEGKPFDGLGGKVEPGESLKTCAVREALEETHVNIDPSHLCYMGISSAYEKPKDGRYSEFHSAIFLLDFAKYEKLFDSRRDGKKIPYLWVGDGDVLPKGRVEWLERLLTFIYSTSGGQSLESWMSSHGGSVVVREAKTYAEAVSEEILGKVPSTTRSVTFTYGNVTYMVSYELGEKLGEVSDRWCRSINLVGAMEYFSSRFGKMDRDKDIREIQYILAVRVGW
jgi:ADP-ribose pyrophosphatase YjhB (NUDIX family)